MSETESSASAVTEQAIESWRMCLTHRPQPELGEFNWPMVLGRCLDEIERLRNAASADGTTA